MGPLFNAALMIIIAVVAMLLTALIICNAVVTRHVYADAYLNPFQKRAQTAIVWLLPLLGAVTVWTLLRNGTRRKRTDGLEADDGLDDDLDDDSDSSESAGPDIAGGHGTVD